MIRDWKGIRRIFSGSKLEIFPFVRLKNASDSNNDQLRVVSKHVGITVIFKIRRNVTFYHWTLSKQHKIILVT